MATNEKYLNISIQPSKVPRTSKSLFELPRDKLSETELVAKSTSDQTKRRVAHVARYPRPVITRPIAPVKSVTQPNPKKPRLPRYNMYGAKLKTKPTSNRTEQPLVHVLRNPQPVITKPIAPVKEVAQPNLEKQNAPGDKLSEYELVAKSTSDQTKRPLVLVFRRLRTGITRPIAPVKEVARPTLEKPNLPRDNLSEVGLATRSTSDRTKRSEVRVAKYPQPVSTRPIAARPAKVIAQPNPEKQHVLRKCFTFAIKRCKARQIDETVALDSRAQHCKPSTSGVDNGVNVNEKKLCDEAKTSKNDGSKKETKIIDEERGNEPHPFKGVEDGVTVHKRKLFDLECGEEIKTKKHKSNVDKTTIKK